MASRHLVRYKKDPVCKIYLRSAKPKEVSQWQKKMLTHLLEAQGLPEVLEEGMKEFEAGGLWPGYDRIDEGDHGDIERHGIVPHLTVSAIVIDDIRNEVIIAAETEWDGNLGEHGITVHFTDGRWRFDYADYQYHYSRAVNTELMERRLAAVFPDINAEARVETDASFLYGTWVFDRKEARKFYKQLKWSKSEVAETLGLLDGRYMTISPTTVVVGDNDGEEIAEFVGCERRGGLVTIRSKSADIDAVNEARYYYSDDVLSDLYGAVFKRKA